MLELRADLFEMWDADPTAILVVTTNGCVSGGRLVMGAGLARACAERVPTLPDRLGEHVARNGNTPVLLPDLSVMSWPTKPGPHTVAGRTHPGWQCMSRVRTPECFNTVGTLTARSGLRVLELTDTHGLTRVLTPRPGCGLGGLSWEKVRPWMQERFDERFSVVELPGR